MAIRVYVFDNEASALKCTSQYGSRAKITDRGDYRHEWLVSLDA